MPTKTAPELKTATRATTKPQIFIDGEAGTTGLAIRQLLAGVTGLGVKSLSTAERKDTRARLAIMREVDLVVLCLPDAAAREAVGLIDALGAAAPRIVDGSTAHRVAQGWVYGFAEMAKGQTAAIQSARRVSNPGCYPTGAIALLRPLVEAGLVPADHPVSVNAVSGYSGGGRAMIEAFESGQAPAFELYGLELEHKHVPELQTYAKLRRRPLFVPSVGNFRQGMLVSVPLHLDTLPGKPAARDLEAALIAHYAGAERVRVVPTAAGPSPGGRLEPEALNGSNDLELRVFANAKWDQVVLVARLDNLGKGAAAAALQNIGLMLGVAV
ncbi:MAG TPA: N-acetyl-gamma-glutamyl-phosphate reductase [Hyphomicrobiaceae bacterium]|nr:N-acetyl-gamma-glutamyl-phosphate reductase [Hyphomicrobiaceae bacterium]